MDELSLKVAQVYYVGPKIGALHKNFLISKMNILTKMNFFYFFLKIFCHVIYSKWKLYYILH